MPQVSIICSKASEMAIKIPQPECRKTNQFHGFTLLSQIYGLIINLANASSCIPNFLSFYPDC